MKPPINFEIKCFYYSFISMDTCHWSVITKNNLSFFFIFRKNVIKLIYYNLKKLERLMKISKTLKKTKENIYNTSIKIVNVPYTGIKNAKDKISGIDYKSLDEGISNKFRSSLKTFITDMKMTFKTANKNHFTNGAASISFYLIFSFFPLMILSFTVTKFFISNESVLPVIMKDFLQTAIPTIAPWISKSIIKLMQKGSYASPVGIIILLWAIYELFQALSDVFEKISFRRGDRDIFGSSVISLFCMFCLIISMNASIIVQGFDSNIIKGLGFILIAISFMFSLTFIFKYMPTQIIKTSNAFFGSIVFIVLFITGRILYEMYIQIDADDLDRMYGVFSTLIYVLIWSYIISLAFIFSAQYSIILQEKHIKKLKAKNKTT